MNADRFWSLVEIRGEAECWPWRGHLNGDGYGGVSPAKHRHILPHRYAYESLIGSIPEGMTIDHLCRNRDCCNPAHMEPVTNRENVMRGDTIPASHAAQTHCLRGHPFDEANTYIAKTAYGRPARACRACHREWQRAYVLRQKGAA